MNRSFFFAVPVFCCAVFASARAAQGDTAGAAVRPAPDVLSVLRITPEGVEVPAGQQIVFQFNRPVVPIGRMERAADTIPVTIAPALECEWRWLNTSALACQLPDDDAMRLATTYRVTMATGIASEDGATLAQPIAHTFTTARPAVTYTRFVNWLSPGTPLIQATFNQPVTRRSVEASLSFATATAKVPVVAFPDDQPRRAPYWRMAAAETPRINVDDRLTPVGDDEARRVWVVEPRAELPLDETLSLFVDPGLRSSEGPEPGIERREVVNFDTFPEFRFLGIRCTLKGQKEPQDISMHDLDTDGGRDPLGECAPLKPIALLFSAPVLNSVLKRHVVFTPALDGGRRDYDPWVNTDDWTELEEAHRKDRIYMHWLPELLRAHQRYRVAIDTAGLSDEFGRRLASPVEFVFHTSHREPDLRLAHHNAVLEQGVDSEVPLYVTNLDEVHINYAKLSSQSAAAGLKQTLPVPPAEDIAYALPMNVRRLLDNASGAIFARLKPRPEPPDWDHDPEIFAQVTPYQIHYKLGHFNSLAWVTEFANGNPVDGARVSLWQGRFDKLPALAELHHAALSDASGLAELPGLAVLDPDLKIVWGQDNVRLFVKVEKGGDSALLPIDYDFAVRGDGVYPYLQQRGGHMHAWGTTAQGIYKLGDTIEYKIYVRDQSNRHWIAPAPAHYALQVLDPQGKIVFENRNVELNAFGAFDGGVAIPATGAIGWYQFQLQVYDDPAAPHPRFTWQPLSVLVSDFTPSPFKVTAELNGEQFRALDLVKLTAAASLHAGGPFTDAEIRVTARLSTRGFETDNVLAKGFAFGSDSGVRLDASAAHLVELRGRLNNLGGFEHGFTLPDSDIYYGTLNVEAAVKDDRGKFIAAAASAAYAGRDRFVGLRNTRWVHTQGETARLEALVVDAHGALLPDVPVAIIINHEETQAARVKGPGNAFLTQNITHWVAESTCQLTTAGDAAAACEFVPQHAGYYQFIAATLDSAGRAHQTIMTGWVTGRGHVVWEESNDATLQIVAEQTDYRIGDTARYLIKNPFPGAQALVSVERYGVLDSWVETLDTSTPVIEVPIKADYLPGFYLSVVAVSPRVAAPLGTGKVDLGKPGYRLGYVSAAVADPYKQLAIDVTTEAAVYKPRDKVRATIVVKPRAGEVTDPVEIAVAVVDESVLAMNRGGRAYYDPYLGFNRLDSLDVNNYSLLSRLVGRQKFEKKGANPGGGGGTADAQLRNLFKFVSYWNPAIRPDKGGTARIEFDVPDNLTGWRILAFAVTPNDRFGLGDANIKVNRPTEIRPVMPNQLIEGDTFKAGFTVMNRSAATRDMNVSIDVSGPLQAGTPRAANFAISVAPYQRERIFMPIATAGAGELKFAVSGGDATDTDAVEHRLPVNRRRSLETAANYGSTTATSVTASIRVPVNIYTDVGSIGAVLAPSVIGNIDGAFNYVRDYPHLCWEQRLTKAVVASAYIDLKAYLDRTVAWPKAAKDIAAALTAAPNFQAENGGMVYWVADNHYVSPYLSAYTAMAFNWLRQSGHAIPAQVETRLHDYLLELLRRDIQPGFYTDGMASTVRAVALAALAGSGRTSAADIDRYTRHVPEMDLFGKAHYLQAAIATPGVRRAVIDDTLASILAHANESGGKFQFSEVLDDSYKYILATPLRANCAALSGLLDAEIMDSPAPGLADIPFKLVHAITQGRGRRDHFENTQENVFCLNALTGYAARYESENPDMRIAVDFGTERIGTAAFNGKTDPAITLTRPLIDADPGTTAELNITKDGPGRVYYAARIAYGLKDDNAVLTNAGIGIRREYSVERDGRMVLLADPMTIKRGELVRVDLFVSMPTARHFVVVDDPVPGGLEPVNADLATSSAVDAAKGEFVAAAGSWFYEIADWSQFGGYFWSFYHQELRHDAARFYADYLPAGNYQLSYTAQAIAEGSFTVMPSTAEEMYDPDVYGKGMPAVLRVGE